MEKFGNDDWMIKLFKEVIVYKEAFYSFEISNIDQQYNQFLYKKEVRKAFILHDKVLWTVTA